MLRSLLKKQQMHTFAGYLKLQISDCSFLRRRQAAYNQCCNSSRVVLHFQKMIPLSGRQDIHQLLSGYLFQTSQLQESACFPSRQRYPLPAPVQASVQSDCREVLRKRSHRIYVSVLQHPGNQLSCRLR